jgi:hypothetical protein
VGQAALCIALGEHESMSESFPGDLVFQVDSQERRDEADDVMKAKKTPDDGAEPDSELISDQTMLITTVQIPEESLKQLHIYTMK